MIVALRMNFSETSSTIDPTLISNDFVSESYSLSSISFLLPFPSS